MLEIVPDEMTTRTLETVESEIILLRDQTARNMLEIGKRLTEAQGLVPRGGWKVWLSEHVGFSYRTAARMMAAYREFGDNPALGRLDSAKLYALLDAPEAIRQELTARPEAIEDKSVRELQAEIKARKAAEKRIEELEAGLSAAMEKGDAAIDAAKRKAAMDAEAAIADARRKADQAIQQAQADADARAGALQAQLKASKDREKEARDALMNAQLVKPDTALAAENARLQAELLKAHDALNQAEAADRWNDWQKQVNARAAAALDGMVRGWLCEQGIFRTVMDDDGELDYDMFHDWVDELGAGIRETAWGCWRCSSDGRFSFSTPFMGGASMDLSTNRLARLVEEMHFSK